MFWLLLFGINFLSHPILTGAHCSKCPWHYSIKLRVGYVECNQRLNIPDSKKKSMPESKMDYNLKLLDSNMKKSLSQHPVSHSNLFSNIIKIMSKIPESQ